MDIAKSIKSIREDKRIKQFEIAEKLDIDTSNYAKLEKRGNKLSFEQIQRIADALGVSLEEIVLYGKNKGHSENEAIEKLSIENIKLERELRKYRGLVDYYISMLFEFGSILKDSGLTFSEAIKLAIENPESEVFKNVPKERLKSIEERTKKLESYNIDILIKHHMDKLRETVSETNFKELFG